MGHSQSKLNEMLLQASTQGDLNGVTLLLQKGAQPESTDKFGRTPLHVACYHGHRTVVALLLNDFTVKQSKPNTSKNNQGSKVRLPVATDFLQRQPLHDAAQTGNVQAAEVLSQFLYSRDVDARDQDGITPLHFAASNGHADFVRFLLDKGANVNAQDIKGDTPLHDASYRGHVEVVEVLLATAPESDLGIEDPQSKKKSSAGWGSFLPSALGGKKTPVQKDPPSRKEADLSLRNKFEKTALEAAGGQPAVRQKFQQRADAIKQKRLDQEARDRRSRGDSSPPPATAGAGGGGIFSSVLGYFKGSKDAPSDTTTGDANTSGQQPQQNNSGSAAAQTPGAPSAGDGSRSDGSPSATARGPSSSANANYRVNSIWTCPRCTLFNQPDAESCAACGAPRPPPAAGAVTAPSQDGQTDGSHNQGSVADQQAEQRRLMAEIEQLRREKAEAEARAAAATAKQPSDGKPTGDKSGAAAGNSNGGDSSGPECCICMENTASYLMVPCGHQCLCGDCRASLEQTAGSRKECPVCKTPYTQIVKVYTT